jgi:hypothetical protein
METEINCKIFQTHYKTEEKNSKARNIADLERLKDQLEKKNSYMHQYKNEQRQKLDEDFEKSHTIYAYDQVKAEAESSEYCSKCKYESQWCKHRKER